MILGLSSLLTVLLFQVPPESFAFLLPFQVKTFGRLGFDEQIYLLNFVFFLSAGVVEPVYDVPSG